MLFGTRIWWRVSRSGRWLASSASAETRSQSTRYKASRSGSRRQLVGVLRWRRCRLGCSSFSSPGRDVRPVGSALAATLLHRQLLSEGFEVSESTVRRFVREWNRQRQETYILLVHRPGEEGRVDFLEVTVEEAGLSHRVWTFVMHLPYSAVLPSTL